MKRRSIRSFLTQFDAGVFTGSSVEIQTGAGWREWLCEDEDLCTKTHTLANKLKEIIRADSGKNIDPDKCFAFFHNMQLAAGTLVDQISICDMQSGKTMFRIIPRGRKGRAELWTAENKFELPVACSTWEDVLRCMTNCYFSDYKRIVF